MTTTNLQTKSLKLASATLEQTRADIAAMNAVDKAQLSADWLARLHALTSDDPWMLGFTIVHQASNAAVESCCFKGPPTADGVVEIAYSVAPEHQGKGYSTETAAAPTSYAFTGRKVRVVRAHTLPESNASTRVLDKCGFQRLGEVIDPEDGLVWRWEKRKHAAPQL